MGWGSDQVRLGRVLDDVVVVGVVAGMGLGRRRGLLLTALASLTLLGVCAHRCHTCVGRVDDWHDDERPHRCHAENVDKGSHGDRNL